MLSSRTGPPLQVVPHGLFSWLALCSSHLLLFSLQVPPFLPGHRATMSSSAYLSAFRTRLKIPFISLRNSWANQIQGLTFAFQFLSVWRADENLHTLNRGKRVRHHARLSFAFT